MREIVNEYLCLISSISFPGGLQFQKLNLLIPNMLCVKYNLGNLSCELERWYLTTWKFGWYSEGDVFGTSLEHTAKEFYLIPVTWTHSPMESNLTNLSGFMLYLCDLKLNMGILISPHAKLDDGGTICVHIPESYRNPSSQVSWPICFDDNHQITSRLVGAVDRKFVYISFWWAALGQPRVSFGAL